MGLFRTMIREKPIIFNGFRTILNCLESSIGGHVVRKLEPIQFPYFGVERGAFGVGGIGLGCRYSMGYWCLIGLLRIIEAYHSPVGNRTMFYLK